MKVLVPELIVTGHMRKLQAICKSILQAASCYIAFHIFYTSCWWTFWFRALMFANYTNAHEVWWKNSFITVWIITNSFPGLFQSQKEARIYCGLEWLAFHFEKCLGLRERRVSQDPQCPPVADWQAAVVVHFLHTLCLAQPDEYFCCPKMYMPVTGLKKNSWKVTANENDWMKNRCYVHHIRAMMKFSTFSTREIDSVLPVCNEIRSSV